MRSVDPSDNVIAPAPDQMTGETREWAGQLRETMGRSERQADRDQGSPEPTPLSLPSRKKT